MCTIALRFLSPSWRSTMSVTVSPGSGLRRLGERSIGFLSATLLVTPRAVTSQATLTEPSARLTPARAGRTAYTAGDLGSLAGDFGNGFASDINPAGQVVGSSQTGFNSSEPHAVLWANGA